MRAPFDPALDCGSPAAALPRPALLAVTDPKQGCGSKKRQQGCRSPKAAPLTPHPSLLTPFRALLTALCALLLSPLAAQEPVSAAAPKDYSLLGYLRFVNATGHEGKLRVFLDGEDINPTGYADGFATGSVGFPPRTCQIELRHDTLGEFKLAVTLKPGEVASVIALPVIRPAKEDPAKAREAKEKPPKVELGTQAIFSPGFVRGKDITVTVLQATIAEKLEVKIGSLPLTCPKLDPATVSLGRGVGEFVPVTLGNKQLLSLNFTDPSDRVVILFTNKDGVLKNITLNNEVF